MELISAKSTSLVGLRRFDGSHRIQELLQRQQAENWLTNRQTVLGHRGGGDRGVHLLIPKVAGSKHRQEVLVHVREQVHVVCQGIIC